MKKLKFVPIKVSFVQQLRSDIGKYIKFGAQSGPERMFTEKYRKFNAIVESKIS